MINQHNQPAQLVNVQRPHQIQPPLRLVPAQNLPQGQPVAIRIQGEPINIQQAQLMNVQGQRQLIAQAPMQQQQVPQIQQAQLMGMGQQIRQPVQQQQQMHHGQNQPAQQQMRGNPQQNQQQMRGMAGGAPHQGQQQHAQMRMQQNQQMMNVPNGQQAPQQRMQTQSNMQQNQQMRMQSGQPQQQSQMRMQLPPQQQMQHRQQSPMNQQQQQQMHQRQQSPMNQQQQQMPQRQMMGNGPQEPMQMQQPMRDHHHQQMQQGPSNMGGPPQQQNRMQHQMPHDQQKMQQVGSQNMNNPSPQPRQQMQHGQQNMNGPPGPMQQNMRVQQHMPQGQQNSQGMNLNQPMQSHQPPLHGQMQNSPQMRMQHQQQFQSSPQQQAPPIQPRTLQPIAPGRSTPQMHQQQQRQQQMPMNRNMQQGPPPQQIQVQEQHQQAPHPMQLPAQAVIQDSGMIRIKGNQAIINGTEFRLMQVQPGSESNGQIQLVNTNPDQNSGVAQSIQLQRVDLPPGGLQKVTLQHRSSSHQLLPPAQMNSSMPQMQRGPPMEQQQRPMMQQNQQQNPPMQNQQQQGMHNMQQRPPSQQSQHQQQPPQPQQAPPPQRPKPPPKPRNRSKKNNANVDPNQAQQSQQQSQQHHDVNGQMNGPPQSMSGTPGGPPSQTSTPQKARGRAMPPQNAQMGQQGPPNGMRHDRNFSPNPQMMQQGKHMVQVGGMPPDVQRSAQTPVKNMPRNQQPMKPGQPSHQRPNGKIPPGSQPSTSQASTSRPKPPDPTDMTVIKDAIISHVRGIRKMTPQYIKYVCDELSRVIREMEKAGLKSDSRYVSTQRLLALVKGEDASKVETPVKEKRPERPSPDDKLVMPDEPVNESAQSRKRRYDGYLDLMTNAYPLKACNVKFARIDDDTIRKEAANYIKQDMKNRAAYLKENLHKFPEHLQTKAKIEYHGLNLVELQEKVRKEVEATLVFEPPTQFLINPWSIRRSKAEYAQELKQHPDRAALERKRRISNNLLLHTLAKHTREFRDFHKGLMNKHTKVRKAMQTHITNEAKKKTREELKNEKLRIQKLILEDEDGYRAMLDDKKDQRLVYLLQQTDGYIESLTELLKKQKSSGEGVTMRNVNREFVGEVDDTEVKTILNKARNEDDDDEDKTKNNFEDYYATAHGIREEIKEQHKTMGGENTSLKLKPYQLKGLEWMVSLFNNNLNGILADEMGLGKTIQTIAFITYLMEIKKTSGPFLVIVPLSTISNWKNEFEKWAPHVSLLIYKGPKDGRKAIEPIIKSGKFNVLLTTFEYVIREKALLGKLRWKYMIIDEGHRLKNQHCKLTEMLNTRFQCQRRLLITGTPLQNKLPELWALLNFLLPAIFSSCSTFEQWFNAPFATTGEKVELTQEETMLIIRRLHKVLRPFLLRRLKKEVESELPDKTEFVIKCDMSALQKVLYKHMQKGLLLDGKQNTGSRTLMNSMVHLRKLCNHPFLFPNVEDSCRIFWKIHCATGTDLFRVAGKLELLDRILPKLQASGHRVLMFFQMTAMMNVIEDYFTARAINYLRLDGSTKPDERGVLLDKFNAPGSQYFLFMLSTRAGGLGLNLQTADTVIIFDSDWNPHQDMQAQDRAHRIGQKAEVRVFRLITANSVEEKILAAARFKLNVDEKVIQAGKFDNRSTGEERKRMLEAIIKAENESEEDDEIPNDEDINDMLSRTDEEYDLFQKMDQERYEHDARTGAKPRLVCQDEIPKDILRAADETDYQEKAKEEGREAYLEVMPGSRRKRKDVDYSADSMSDDKFLEKLFDGEDLAPERTEPREEPPVVKPDVVPENPPLTFKVPRLVFKFGEETKRKHKKSESDSDGKDEKSPRKQKKNDENRKEQSEKPRHEPPIEKLKIKLSLNPDSVMSKIDDSPRKRNHDEGSSRKHKEDRDSTPKKKKKRRDSEDVETPEKKKHKHKHRKQDDLESPVKPKNVSSTSGPPTTSKAGNEVVPPLTLKLPKLIIKMPPQLSEAVSNEEKKKEHRKREREEETEEERKARKAAKKEKKRLLAEQEEQARAQEKLAKKARKEQRRLEKEKLEAAGSASKSSTMSGIAPESPSSDIVVID